MSFIMNFTSKTENDSFDYPIIQENIQRKVKILKSGIHRSLDGFESRSKILKVVMVWPKSLRLRLSLETTPPKPGAHPPCWACCWKNFQQHTLECCWNEKNVAEIKRMLLKWEKCCWIEKNLAEIKGMLLKNL